jgi:hypothetical protein
MTAGSEPDVSRHPPDAVAQGRKHEEARKKQTENRSHDQKERMNAQPSDGVAGLVQELMHVIHDVSPCDFLSMLRRIHLKVNAKCLFRTP